MSDNKKVNIKKKKSASKSKTNKVKKKSGIIDELKKGMIGIAVLISVCLTMAMIADIIFQPDHFEREKFEQKEVRKITPLKEVKGIKNKTIVKNLKKKPDNIIKYEIFDDIDETIVKKKFPPVKDHIPKIAIIIDDIGYDKNIALALCDLNPDITFSILPFSPFGKDISKKLNSRGAQLMLHLPMEPVEYPHINPGPGAILSEMSPDTLLSQLRKNIRDVPYIAGANNHMGSKLTANSDRMNQVFTVLKKENLFFVDSRTSPMSQCRSSARLFNLKFAQRDIFLDNFQDIEYITGQLYKLVYLAKKHGSAIGIGHPYKTTLHVLEKELPKLNKKIRIVRAGSLTGVP